GRPADWDRVKAAIPKNTRLLIYAPDYFKDPQLSPQHNFANWAKNFNRWVQMQTHNNDKNILIGYSLGGRLALHALEQKPTLWSEAVLVSANTGFNDSIEGLPEGSDERRKRWINDTYWAEQFNTSSWETLLRNWNAQPIFGGGDEEPVRLEKDYSRDSLGLALAQWSLAQQKNMRLVLKQNSGRISWVVGERDEKMMNLLQDLLGDVPQLKFEIISDSSHRVLFDKPQELAKIINELVEKHS
ncbi:MAG TPA: alpha/beta fold hydrolase, partial [Bdellovibrio sp.]|nr:alpha/beta fold hydrolase [Bdellovibrio sp.]